MLEKMLIGHIHFERPYYGWEYHLASLLLMLETISKNASTLIPNNENYEAVHFLRYDIGHPKRP
jgi:hypothetical protein